MTQGDAPRSACGSGEDGASAELFCNLSHQSDTNGPHGAINVTNRLPPHHLRMYDLMVNNFIQSNNSCQKHRQLSSWLVFVDRNH